MEGEARLWPRDADAALRVREEQIGLLYAFPEKIVGHAVNAGLVTAVVWDKLDHAILLAWLIFTCAVTAARYGLCRAFRRRHARRASPMGRRLRRRPAGARDIETWAKRFLVGAGASAALWGASTFAVWLTPDIAYHVFIAFVIAGTCATATATSYPQMPAVYLFLGLSALPLSANLFLAGDGISIAMALMTVLFVVVMMGQARVANEVLLRSLTLQEENRALVAELSAARDELEIRVRERAEALEATSETLRAEMAARMETESRLQQAQKMEAIGQLTGGIAHDFNNLLAVIQGNTELLSELLEGETGKREVQAVLRASERGAQLTQRLLAFSRKQTLRPKAVNVNDLVTSMTDMLGRTLGAEVQVRVRFVPGANLPPARVDPGQLEAAILNLAINARDAMPGGGEVTITTDVATLVADSVPEGGGPGEAVRPGRYVVAAVGDTGTGIPEEHLHKVWEPFFTTKRAGEGTGLGLSMVYGFIRQSGGQVTIQSKLGEGTTVRLFLPVSIGPEKEAPIAREDITGIPTGSEYVFLIEDDDEVRALVKRFLRRLGYRVVTAANAEEAFRNLAVHGKPDLFLSDVMLPGGHRGPNVVAGARRQFGPVKAIFISGHASGGVVDSAVLGEGSVLIHKPFELGYLARRVRAALDGEPA